MDIFYGIPRFYSSVRPDVQVKIPFILFFLFKYHITKLHHLDD